MATGRRVRPRLARAGVGDSDRARTVSGTSEIFSTRNAEAISAWDGPLYDRFLRFRHIVTTGLGAHGERALALYPPRAGQQVLDIGCGFGDTTQRIARLLGTDGEATGVDAATRFIETARRESLEAGDRKRQTIVEQIVSRPEEYDEPTCGPGPFSMSDADTTSEILAHAGYKEVALYRCDEPIMIGLDVDEAIEILMALGPAGEILRLQGDRAAPLHTAVREALQAGLAEFVTDDGVIAPASSWIVSATNAADGSA